MDMYRGAKPNEASRPPATYFNRTIGQPHWHGFAKYGELLPLAERAYPFPKPAQAW